MAHLIPSFVINTVFFILTLLAVVFILCKVGPSSLDRIAIILMVNFLMVTFMRFLSMVFHEIFDQSMDSNFYFVKALPIILNICELLTQISLSLFVFEMQTIRNRLQTDSPQEFKAKERSNRISRVIVLGYLLFYGATVTLGDILEQEISSPVVIADIILRCIKFIADAFLLWLFTKNFIYFVRLKRERLEARDKQFTVLNLVIIGWTVALMLLCAYQSVGAIVIGFLEYIYLGTKELHNIHEFIGKNDRYVFPIKDFLILMTMLYLFFEQGKRLKFEDRLKSEN